MRDSAVEQQIEGFGQWEFLTELGATLAGNARELYNEYMEKWDFLNPNCPNMRRAENVELDRARWRIYRRDRALWMTQIGTCGLIAESVVPRCPEPDDLEDFIENLQERFCTSTTANLIAIHNFEVRRGEPSESL